MLMTLMTGALLALAPMQQDTTVPVQPGTRLQLNAHQGEIIVRTWNRNAVQASADLSSRDRLEVSVEGNVVRVRSASRRGAPRVTDYRLTVPVWMDLELGTVSGDIRVDGTEGRVTATSVEGNVTVHGGREFVSIHSIEGEVEAIGIRGRLEVNSVDGNIVVGDVVGAIYAETVDGAITLDRVQSDNVEASTVDGDIIYRGPIARSGRYKLGSHDGNITLEVPEPLNATVSTSTFSGDFTTCGYTVTLSGNGSYSKRRFRFSLGDGSARIDLESFDGTIAINKPGCR